MNDEDRVSGGRGTSRSCERPLRWWRNRRASVSRALPSPGLSSRLVLDIRPFFIGARRGIERDVLPTAGFPFELLDLHPLYRSAPWNNWRTIVGATSAWRRVAALVAQHRPAALVATGGYVAGVALAYASRHRIPIVIQEQNSFPGMTVKWFARRASQIHLGFPEAAALLKLKAEGGGYPRKSSIQATLSTLRR